MTGIDLPLILAAAVVASASPGPATLAIAGASMTSGRARGLALAAGVLTGSLMWSTAAAFGMGALMLANAWAFEVMRYVGAVYLGWLAWKSARSALRPGANAVAPSAVGSARRAYGKGLTLHLTNPKAILFFGSLYAVGIPQTAGPMDVLVVLLSVAAVSATVFHGYALLFSTPVLTTAYARARRGFDAICAVFFALAAFKIFTARLT
ncbi:MAG: LysE family translocator [Pikeienuella sp.]